ncbi:group III truncated hemoglobin [Carboxylicivirga caseinilyticus]|uniref:group III truncated hemoglobin n=1 Tax=Carboxylicivirga caseinilyticus TaxID=3417572 RepID=UPI003D338C72|nr:group III truncated hemoglobin [Marinilabiliaceae bacterium A049]
MMNKPDLNNRDNIEKQVRAFYKKVRKDDLLGPFFNQTITSEVEWEEHLLLLTSFWELNLLDVRGFNGNPGLAHQGVDKAFKHSITTNHFDRWVAIWKETIDEHFEGEKAEYAKMRATNMAKGMYKKVIDKRPGGFIIPGGASGLSFG